VRAFSADANGTNFGDGVGVPSCSSHCPPRCATTTPCTRSSSARRSTTTGSRKVGYNRTEHCRPGRVHPPRAGAQRRANRATSPTSRRMPPATPVGDRSSWPVCSRRTAPPAGHARHRLLRDRLGQVEHRSPSARAATHCGLIKKPSLYEHRQLPADHPRVDAECGSSTGPRRRSYLQHEPAGLARGARPARAAPGSAPSGRRHQRASGARGGNRPDVDGPRRPRRSRCSPGRRPPRRPRASCGSGIADHFQTLPEEDFADAAHTLRVGRTTSGSAGRWWRTGRPTPGDGCATPSTCEPETTWSARSRSRSRPRGPAARHVPGPVRR
jgi:hypothetical protein